MVLEDALLYAGSGLAAWALSAVPYTVGLALVNGVYRISSGRFFRWFSKATVTPFVLLLPVWLLVSYVFWSNVPGPK
ncbi:hypothetical protein [Hyalangium gracile]|uniref:hypothetical protein n=1 Tax=Hyalangium gracile TaxID=394092 RepID=UPI001CC95326|nr:hypothetical protein [Hyalangium gracile]